MAQLQHSVSITKYLATAYHPDVDYVDGRIEERNVGEKSHGKLQRRVADLLERTPAVFAFIETRLKISDTNYRVPDVCAYLDHEPDEEIFTVPPLLCVEILSPEDRLTRTITKAVEYRRMGVPHVWVLDPLKKTAYVLDVAEQLSAVTREINAGVIDLNLSEIFS